MTVGQVLSPAAGAALVALVAVDAFRTVLLPAAGGPLNDRLTRGVWHLSRAAPARTRPAVLRVSGPLSLVLTVVTWELLLLLGFALVYLPRLDTLVYSEPATFPEHGLLEALYVSGAALTTLGFGDVVAGTPWLRLLTVAEAGAGLGVLTAALGYLPAIYTLVSELRSSNQAVSDLGAEDPQGAAELLTVDPTLVLDDVRRDVLAARQHLQRFPVLHYFHPPYEESVVALVRGGLGLWVAAHFVQDEGRPLHRLVEGLGRALQRLVEDLAAQGGSPHGAPDAQAAARRFDEARRLSAHPDGAREGEAAHASLQRLAQVQAALDAYAGRHGYPAGGPR